MNNLLEKLVIFLFGRLRYLKCLLLRTKAYELCKEFMLDANVEEDLEIGKYYYHTFGHYNNFYDKYGVHFTELWELLSERQQKVIIFVADEHFKINKK